MGWDMGQGWAYWGGARVIEGTRAGHESAKGQGGEHGMEYQAGP